MLNKIKNCLSNEIGGPNLETLLGIGMSLCVMGAIYYVARNLYDWVYSCSLIVKAYNE